MDGLPRYEDDFFAWTQVQARLLREAAAERPNAQLDWANLAEEIDSMGRSDAKALGSAIMRVIEHLLKLEHSPAAAPRAGWRTSVVNQRIAAWEEIDASPSLRGRVDLERAYARGRRLALDGLAADGAAVTELPGACPYALEQILDDDWWPVNRHGLS